MGAKSSEKDNNKTKTSMLKTFLGLILIVIVAFLAISLKESSAEETVAINESGVDLLAENPTGFTLANTTSEGNVLKNKKKAKKEPRLEDIVYEQQALPVIKNKQAEQIITHRAYSVSYNKDYKVPNWVFYELTRAETKGHLERSNNFQADPALKFEDASHLEDYRKSGWDRGHMAPSMDMNWDAEVLDESYLLSNMCPQGHDFNSGIWLDLEHEVRFWAKRDSAICVVCGPVLPASGNKYKTLPHSQVLIPEYFYKIVFAPFAKNGPRAIAFVMPNRNEKRKVSSYAVTIDEVEELTGIDFFPILPDYIEDKIEGEFELPNWFRSKDI